MKEQTRVQTTVRISPVLKAQLQHIAAVQGVRYSRLIEDVLKQHVLDNYNLLAVEVEDEHTKD